MILLICSAVFAALSLPMVFRLVPMNHLYGARFPQSFKSEAHWHAINRVGGFALLAASIPMAFIGAVSIAVGCASEMMQVVVLMVATISTAAYSYFQARSIDSKISADTDGKLAG